MEIGMPSIRKRIGYLPSINIQDIITKISTKEKLSQSKVVGILVEEALIARGEFDNQKTKSLNSKNLMENSKDITNSSFEYNDFDELISDKGITYNTKKNKLNSDNILSKTTEKNIEELFEQFKQFIQFQNMINEK